MKISSEFLYRQMKRISPLVEKMGVEQQRHGQDRLGKLLSAPYRRRVKTEPISLSSCPAVWVTPDGECSSYAEKWAVLYLHGGGYVTGGEPYVSGVAARLCDGLSLPVLAPVYRLAPEHPYPAATEDALAAWNRLLAMGYPPHRIILWGESAGGGLCLALCLMLKAKNSPLPAGQILLSPWVDLTHSGESISQKADVDPSLSLARLERFAESYCKGDQSLRTEPLCSPLFGDLSGLSPTLILVGDAEILFDDSIRLHAALESAGCTSSLYIAPNLWHAYTLYPISEADEDMERMKDFLKKLSAEWSTL